MSGFTVDQNDPGSDRQGAPQRQWGDGPNASRPRRSVFPWILAATLVAFTLGMLASPWFETTIRSRLPFGMVKPVQPATPSMAPAVVEKRLHALETQTASGVSAQQSAMVTDVDQRVNNLEERFNALDARSSRALANSARAEGMLMTLAARRAIDTGQQLGVIEGMLRERFGGTQPQAVATLIAAGQRPVTLSQLQAGLQAMEPDIKQAARGGNWWEELRNDLSSLIIIRREGTPAIEPVSQLADARTRLMMGDVAGALWQMNRMPSAARAQAAPWIKSAQRYVAARNALDTLETVALLAPPPGHEENIVPLPTAREEPTPLEQAGPAR